MSPRRATGRGAAAGPVRVYLEVGSRRTFACAVDWPGWCRSGKGTEEALEVLAEYVGRYRAALEPAGIEGPVVEAGFDVVETLESSAADFGTIQVIPSIDRTDLPPPESARMVAIVRAAWTYFDGVVATAPPGLRRGPRGGGRDRDAIGDHVVGAEADYARRLGVRGLKATFGDGASTTAVREAIIGAVAGGLGADLPPERKWPSRTGARRVAWHALDHAWEIEDKSE